MAAESRTVAANRTAEGRRMARPLARSRMKVRADIRV
jgi:hypothetical protein